MPARKSTRIANNDRLTPRVKVWLEVGGQYGFGFGIAEILQAVDRVGSIKLAASRLNRSYRYVWNRIKKAEDALGLTLVETQVGGQGLQRSNLTDTARHLVVDFMAIRNRIMKVMTQESARRFALRNATRRPLSF